jgi:ribosomal protein S1
MNKLVFSDEVTFRLLERAVRHNLRMRSSENPHESFEHERHSPKVNVLAAVSRVKLYGPFFFIESKVTGIIYLDMLREWLMPHLQEDIPDIPTTLHELKTRITLACANID